jgi:hypothetical protein
MDYEELTRLWQQVCDAGPEKKIAIDPHIGTDQERQQLAYNLGYSDCSGKLKEILTGLANEMRPDLAP